MLSTRVWIVSIDTDSEHRRKAISIVKSDVKEVVMKFIAFDLMV